MKARPVRHLTTPNHPRPVNAMVRQGTSWPEVPPTARTFARLAIARCDPRTRHGEATPNAMKQQDRARRPVGPSLFRPTRHRSRGQALVEFALVIPVFLLVLSGILDFGFMLFSRMSVINAAREGARAAAMTADDTTIPTVVTNRVISAAATGGITVVPSNVTLACLQTSSSSFSAATNTPRCTWTLYSNLSGCQNLGGAQPGDSVSATVTYRYQSFFPLLFGTGFDLRSTVQMVLDNVSTRQKC